MAIAIHCGLHVCCQVNENEIITKEQKVCHRKNQTVLQENVTF